MTAPTASNQDGTVNGVAIPAGMTETTFTQLVVAKQGVMTFLDPKADASVQDEIATASDAWFEALGPYFVQQLAELSVAGTPIALRVTQYVVAHPVAETVTAEQDAAAVASINNLTPKIVSVTPPVVPTPSAPAVAPAPAIAVVKKGESEWQIIGEDVHAAIERALAFIKKEF
jgi:hypothetical protein